MVASEMKGDKSASGVPCLPYNTLLRCADAPWPSATHFAGSQTGTTIPEMKKEESIDADYLAPAKYDQYYGAYATLPDWFLAELASRGRVLELACGTGRIAIPLAEHGIEVTGIDYSEPMLSLARSKAEGRQVKVEWIRDDIRCFDTGRQYGSVLLLHNALWHLHDLADFEEWHSLRGGVISLRVVTSFWTFLSLGWRSSIATQADGIHSLDTQTMKLDKRCK